MTFLEVTFEDRPAEALLSSLKPGDTLSAARLLTQLDGESESVLEEIFDSLADLETILDIDDLPQYKGDTETARRLRTEAQLAKQGNLLDKLDAEDPLRMYLQELAEIPACGEMGALSAELQQANKNEEITNAHTEVVNLCLSRVVELACGYAGKGVLLMDLIQEGSMGLWERLPCYESGELEAFCDFWVNWYMKKAVFIQAYATGVGQKLRQAMEDYKAVDEKLLAELGRNPTVEELAEGLHMSVPETETVMEMLESAKLIHQVKTPRQTELPQEEDQAVEDTAYFQMRQRIAELLSVLPEKDAKLLSLRYGLEGGIPKTTEQVAKALGLTPEEVTASEAAALAKLRTQN